MPSWKPVPGYEGLYEVSDQGALRAVEKLTATGARRQPRMLAPTLDPAGYRRIVLWRDGSRRTWKLHHLVLLAFVGPRPDGLVACHRDGDKTNNAAANLRWDTISANNYDNVQMGVHVQTRKTTCPQGHPYDEANTRHGKQGAGRWNARRCIICARRACRDSAARRRLALKEKAA